MKKLVCFLTCIALSASGAIAEVNIPKGFEKYRYIDKILSDRSYPERKIPVRIVLYDNNGDGKADVEEIYPMRHNGRFWETFSLPTIYKFDKNYNGEFEEEEIFPDLEGHLKWKGYQSEEEA